MYCVLTGKGSKEEDFEIHKKEDSVQKKRHYRNNNKDNDSSGSDSDAEHSRRVSSSALYLSASKAVQYVTKSKFFIIKERCVVCHFFVWLLDLP